MFISVAFVLYRSIRRRHLHCAGQALQFDGFLAGIERFPILAVDRHALDGQCLRVPESQHDSGRGFACPPSSVGSRRAGWYFHRGIDLAVVHVGDDLVTRRPEVGRRVLHRDLPALLQPCPRRA